MKMPKVIYITRDENSEETESFLAWGDLQSADDGKVGVYQLVEELTKREVVEIRNKRSRRWFKP